MLGAGPAHGLAPELTLRPVLDDVLDSRHDDPEAYAGWLDRVRPLVLAQTGAFA